MRLLFNIRYDLLRCRPARPLRTLQQYCQSFIHGVRSQILFCIVNFLLVVLAAAVYDDVQNISILGRLLPAIAVALMLLRWRIHANAMTKAAAI